MGVAGWKREGWVNEETRNDCPLALVPVVNSEDGERMRRFEKDFYCLGLSEVIMALKAFKS